MIGLTLLTKTPKLNFPLILYRMDPRSAVLAHGPGPPLPPLPRSPLPVPWPMAQEAYAVLFFWIAEYCGFQDQRTISNPGLSSMIGRKHYTPLLTIPRKQGYEWPPCKPSIELPRNAPLKYTKLQNMIHNIPPVRCPGVPPGPPISNRFKWQFCASTDLNW